ncbi:MAG: hypothetical protein RL060_1738 [Bacteroidota bacterium]|jgi:hypothetical protein
MKNQFLYIFYISNREKICTNDHINEILDTAQFTNSQDTVTGLLMYSKTHFIQYIEGPILNVNRLFAKIKLDYRHRNCLIISTQFLDERIFPSWQMASKSFDENKLTMISEMSQENQLAFQSFLNRENCGKSIVQKFMQQFVESNLY